MIMNDQEKIIAILNNYQVRNDIEARALVRLMYSDLSHIGAALLSGETILSNNNNGPFYFKNPRSYYTIKQPTIMFNGCEINPPIAWEDFDPQGDFVCCATPVGVISDCRQDAIGYIKAGVAFNNYEDAEAYREAAGWVVS
tara:strand:- start:1162 stop:1584 length:423 start_codon:yes stop_codon:yes gene_type:complete